MAQPIRETFTKKLILAMILTSFILLALSVVVTAAFILLNVESKTNTCV